MKFFAGLERYWIEVFINQWKTMQSLHSCFSLSLGMNINKYWLMPLLQISCFCISFTRGWQDAKSASLTEKDACYIKLEEKVTYASQTLKIANKKFFLARPQNILEAEFSFISTKLYVLMWNLKLKLQ